MCILNFLEDSRGMYDFIWSHVRSMTCVPATRDPLDPFETIFVNCPSLWPACSTLFHSTCISFFCKLLDEYATTYQEHLEGSLKKMLQRIRNILKSYLKKMLQRIRNVLQVNWRRCYNVSGTPYKLLDEDVTTHQEHLEKLLDEDVTTYQKRFYRYLKKMLQRSRNILKVTWRRGYNVAGNRYWQRRPQDPPWAPSPKTSGAHNHCQVNLYAVPVHSLRCDLVVNVHNKKRSDCSSILQSFHPNHDLLSVLCWT